MLWGTCSGEGHRIRSVMTGPRWVPSKANAGHLPHGDGPHPVLSVQKEGNISGQEPQSPLHLPLAQGGQSKHSGGGGVAGQQVPPGADSPCVTITEPESPCGIHTSGLSPQAPGWDLPELGAGPHSAVGEGSFTLPHLLGQQAGQCREVNPWGRWNRIPSSNCHLEERTTSFSFRKCSTRKPCFPFFLKPQTRIVLRDIQLGIP